MTLILRDEDVQGLLPMTECITAMEHAFADYAEGIAVNRPRVRYLSASPNPDSWYFANILVGSVPRYDAAAVRIGSARTRPRTHPAGQHVRQHMDRHWGNFLLYSLETAELLAIISDFTLGPIRVAATTAIAIKHLAREGASVLGLLGTGKQAVTNLEAALLIRPFSKVKVYSPNPEHRRNFAREMSARFELPVEAVDEPLAAVRGVDVVSCATNALEPTFDGIWLEPGQLVTSIVTADQVRFKTEVDETSYMRSDAICINDKESVLDQRQRFLLDPIEQGLFTWDKVHELGQVIHGSAPARRRPEDLILYHNNTGMGIQFAAAGAVAYRQAVHKGVGKEVPTEWFGADLSGWYEKGYI